ncbi:hypothetical protein P879_08284 [Paragonimus westermani]|uniref:Uncharacterized protein n=1 Tax=Paragonimus westermani TaxID=34504 RepID=A0A8T0DG96_9TREM|nr:hypothetical protein P879_08284 [Paragonimus westermani]
MRPWQEKEPQFGHTMKVLLAVLVLFVALLSRLTVRLDGNLGEKTAVIALSADQCYQRITDFSAYPRWMVSVKSTEASQNAGIPQVGHRFVITTDWGFLGTMSYDVFVIKADGHQTYVFDVDNWLGLRVDAYIIPTGHNKCKLRLKVTSRVKNILQKWFIHPFARLYYTNWLTHSLLAFQLTYS